MPQPKPSRLSLLAASLVIAGCGSGKDPAEPPIGDPVNATAPSATSPSPKKQEATGGWAMQASGEGTALVLLEDHGNAQLRLFCPSGKHRILVNVPGFRPIGSEERLSFGSGDAVVALVADTRGDAQRGGVSGTGDVPENLAELIKGSLSASYGAQTSGAHPAPPTDMSQAFVAACRSGPAAPAAPVAPVGGSARACLMQGSERLAERTLRAVGTEPFWAARIEGRCVTYSHPDDQDGTRVWTRYAKAQAGETWSGSLQGRAFELRVRAEPGCSDGMSDKRYPLAVDLTVNGEKRSGCAEPV